MAHSITSIEAKDVFSTVVAAYSSTAESGMPPFSKGDLKALGAGVLSCCVDFVATEGQVTQWLHKCEFNEVAGKWAAPSSSGKAPKAIAATHTFQRPECAARQLKPCCPRAATHELRPDVWQRAAGAVAESHAG
jgi:hypothetical protein